MKVLHLANWNSTNIGNGALIYGSQKVFAEDVANVEFIPEAWDDYTFKRKKFDASFVELVNNTADVLMVNGAVTFNAFRRNMKHTGMRFDLPLSLWDEIKVPIVLYGLSYRCWPFQTYPNQEAFKKMLEYVISSSHVFFGVRNDGTKEWIKRTFGIESDRIHEIPDPGMFVPYLENETYPEIRSDKRNILVAFNGEDAVYRYVLPGQKILWKLLEPLLGIFMLEKIFGRLQRFFNPRRTIVKKLARTVENIAEKNPDARFVLVPHYLDDYGMIQEFIEEVQERIAHQVITSTGLVSVPETEYFYGRYKQADLVLAMRVHSMSPCIGMGVPVVPITSQGRMRRFLEKMNLSDIAVDVEDDDFVQKLVFKAQEILDNPEKSRVLLQESIARVREEMRTKNNVITEFIKRHPKN